MNFPRWATALLTGAMIGVAAISTGLWGTMRAPELATYRVEHPRWPSGSPPLRIVHLSDTHASTPYMSAARLRGIVARVNALRPDLVVLTGDYVGDKTLGGTPLAAAEAVSPFGNLRPRIGTFAVLGNHDHWFDPAGLAAALRRSGIHVLTNEHVSAGPVIVAGVDDEFTGRADLARALRGINADRPVILLSHSPDVFPEVDERVGVTVAGHTHGGQIALPFIGPLATASKYGKRYAHGHVVESGRHLIVSAGLGTSLLPLRIGVPPEIVLVTIH